MNDDRYILEARREILGPDFARNPNLDVPAQTLSRIATRADELKRADRLRDREISMHELTSDLRALGQQDFSVALHYLADRVYYACLSTGGRLRDVMDVKQWLEEIAESVK
jgi:hypothetical protein